MGWPSLESKARHTPTPSKRDLGVPMAAPLSGTEVPCWPQSDESPTGYRPSPAGTTELAAAEASAGVAVASIAPVGTGGERGIVGVSGESAATVGVGKKKGSRNALRKERGGHRGIAGAMRERVPYGKRRSIAP